VRCLTLAFVSAATIAGCSGPREAEPDFSPFIDVWTADPPPASGKPVTYLILQGDFSVCHFTVRSPKDADYAGGEYDLTPKQLTLKLTLENGRPQTLVYAVQSWRRGELHLADITQGGAGQPIVMKHATAYSSCADAQTRLDKQFLKRR